MLPSSRFCIHYVNKSVRLSSGHRTGKGQSSSQTPGRGVPKNMPTIGQLYSSHASNIMLKSLHARLQHYGNQELADVQDGFRKGRGTRHQIAKIHWIIEKAREFQKNIYLCFIDYTKTFDCSDHNTLWKALKAMGVTRPSYLSPKKPVWRSKSSS